MILPDKWYKIIKWAVTVVLPAVATFLSALNAAWSWGLPIEAILTTFAAVEALLGTILGISGHNYYERKSGD